MGPVTCLHETPTACAIYMKHPTKLGASSKLSNEVT